MTYEKKVAYFTESGLYFWKCILALKPLRGELVYAIAEFLLNISRFQYHRIINYVITVFKKLGLDLRHTRIRKQNVNVTTFLIESLART